MLAHVLNNSLTVALGIVPLCIAFSLGGAEAFGLSRATLANGGWFVLFTFMFAHESIGHLLLNLAGLVLAGVMGKETGLSGLRFMLIFFAVGFAVVSLVFLIPTPYVFMGASAGICGLLGAEAVGLGRYGLSPAKFFLIFALALMADSVVETLLASPAAAVQAFIHLAALSLGSAIVLIHRSTSARRSDGER